MIKTAGYAVKTKRLSSLVATSELYAPNLVSRREKNKTCKFRFDSNQGRTCPPKPTGVGGAICGKLRVSKATQTKEAEMPKYVIVVVKRISFTSFDTRRIVDHEFQEADDTAAIEAKRAYDRQHKLSEAESTLYRPV